jgi:hypothetical protein
MPQQTRVHNPGPFEVVIDNAGHQLAGFTSTTIEVDARTSALLSGGVLILPSEPPAEDPKPTTKKKAAASDAGAETGAN